MTQMSFLTAKNLLYPKFNKEAILKTLVAPELEDFFFFSPWRQEHPMVLTIIETTIINQATIPTTTTIITIKTTILITTTITFIILLLLYLTYLQKTSTPSSPQLSNYSLPKLRPQTQPLHIPCLSPQLPKV
jgi:hypothetical protein